MEEVDKIILVSLRQTGCGLADAVTSLDALSANDMVKACAHCLRLISQLTFPDSLPPEMSGRFRLGQNLASAIKDLEYPEEIGYHQFLYPAPHDTRKILRFLIDRLPKSSSEAQMDDDAETGVLGSRSQRQTSAAAGISLREATLRAAKFATKKSWSAAAGAGPSAVPTKRPFDHARSFPCECLAFYSRAAATDREIDRWMKLKSLPTRQQAVQDLQKHLDALKTKYAAADGTGVDLSCQRIPPLAEMILRLRSTHDRRRNQSHFQAEAMMFPSSGTLAKLSMSSSSSSASREGSAGQKAEAASEPTEAEREALRQQQKRQQVEALQQKLLEVQEAMNRQQALVAECAARRERAIADTEKEKDKQDPLKDRYKQCKRLARLLTDGDKDANAKALEEDSRDVSEDIRSIAAEWDGRRAKLEDKHQQLVSMLESNQTVLKKRQDEIAAVRNEITRLGADLVDREGRVKQLQREVEALPKDVDRAGYVRRIYDIVKNVKKQQSEISKILGDIRAVQKQISSTSEAVSRSFAVTEELIFREAAKEEATKGKTKDDFSKESYGLLIRLKEAFQNLVLAVEQTGQLRSEAQALQRRIAEMSSRTSSYNFDQVAADLHQLRMENENLQKVVQ